MSLDSLKRCFDLTLASAILMLLAPPFVFIALLVRITSPGPILYWSNRVGQNNTIFRMPKFRSMRIDTPPLATHLLESPNYWLTPLGSFLRKSSIDELPQLWCIIKGEMSFVGPRPALFNQDDLITMRTESGIHKLLPGLTGWAQVNGRDELSVEEKVKLDLEYANRRSLGFDLWILWLTALQIIRWHKISH